MVQGTKIQLEFSEYRARFFSPQTFYSRSKEWVEPAFVKTYAQKVDE